MNGGNNLKVMGIVYPWFYPWFSRKSWESHWENGEWMGIMRKMTGEKSWTSIWTAMIRGQVKMWLWTNLGYPKIWRLRQTSLKSTSVFCQRNGENHHLNHHHLLVGAWPTPLKIMELKSVGIMKFPTFHGKSFKIPWFQSPPTRGLLWDILGLPSGKLT